MTKQLTTSAIIAQKIEHINFYREDNLHEALFIGMARDACYTAHNSVSFKKKQLADMLAEYDRHMAEKDDNAADRCERFAGRLGAELEVLEERFDIEKAVYFTMTGGEEWTPYTKKTAPPRKSNVDMSALRNKLAS